MWADFLSRCMISVLVYSIIILPVWPSIVFAAQSASALAEGIQLYESGMYEQSRSKLAEAGAKEPDNSAIYIYLGLSQMQLGNSANAISSFERYLQLSPDSPEAADVRKNLTLLKTSYTKEEVKGLVSGERKMFTGPETAKTIAVYTPVNLGDTTHTHLGRGLASMVIHDLVQAEKFTVVERMRMQALLDELALSGSDLTARDTELRTGRLLGAGRVIPGSFSVNKKSIAINTSLIRTDIGYTLGRQMASGSMAQFWELEKMLVFSILKDLGVKKDDMPASVLSRVEKIHTKNLAAFSAYSAGVVATDNEDYGEAKKQFDKALEEDEDFELAALAVLALPIAAFGVAAIISSLEGSASVAAGTTKTLASGTTAATTSTGAGTGTSAGLSTTTWVAIGAGAVAVTAGTAAALGGGGSGGGGGDDITTVEGTWNFHLRCAGESSDASLITLNLNETTGGSYSGSGSGTDYNGTPMQHTLSGFYNSSNHNMTGELTSTFSGSSCVRVDNFNITLDSGDSGYFFMNQTQACGCDGEGRLVKQ